MFRLGPLSVFVGWIMLSAVSVGLAIAVSFSGIF
ncbi:hypothetical protein R75461_04800 [Paraburkholderia nemoris]|nr:hypothetical protein LMG22931_00061 [Paraburkholderia nemoris]CAE6792506.1 hypothetical protein R75461_04800 [Paraburkholderia nemoris]SOE56419.1 hypothetical protein SAMN05446635_1068 [Burkholderia sp. OK233]